MPVTLTTSDQASQTLSVIIRRLYETQIESSTFLNNRLLGLFPRVPGADQSTRWKLHNGVNSAVETFVEGQAEPSAGAQAYINADLAYTHFRGVVQVTGHAMAALANGAAYFNVVDEEFSRIQEQIVDLITTTGLGATGMGMQLAVDNTGTYAGVNHTTTGWDSQEDAVGGGGALTKNVLDQLFRELIDAERAAVPSLIITSPTQIENYHQLGIDSVAGSTGRRLLDAPGGATGVDLGTNWAAASFNGIPIVAMPDLTNTVWLMLQRDKWDYVEQEGVKVLPLARNDNSDRWEVTMRGALRCRNPFKQGKLTGVTP